MNKLLLSCTFIAVLYGAGCRRQAGAPNVFYTIDLPDGSTADLEFRILANDTDDRAAIDAAQLFFNSATPGSGAAKDLEKRALAGRPPPPPTPADAKDNWPFTYSWVELAPSELKNLGLHPDAVADAQHKDFRKEVEAAREKGELLFTPHQRAVLYSRPCRDDRMSKEDRNAKECDCFFLTREAAKDPKTGESKAITGKYLTQVSKVADATGRPAVNFRLNDKGGQLFYDLTSSNIPTGPLDNQVSRHIAIILERRILTAPRILSAIRSDGQITGNFTDDEVERMIRILQGKRPQ